MYKLLENYLTYAVNVINYELDCLWELLIMLCKVIFTWWSVLNLDFSLVCKNTLLKQ